MNIGNTHAMNLSYRKILMGSAAIMMAFAAPMAYGQTDDEPAIDTIDDNEIVATGIRQSILKAQQIKRNADTFVDSITASDVSTLPDLSVAEALARVPGVTVTRFASGGSNGDFPAPEGSGNLIRGLGFVRSEFNGRDAFSANGGRALDWSSIPPELIGGVDVYKNQSADLIEGGIGGSINLRTLEPFDRDGLTAVVIAEGTYTDLRDKIAPSFSAILGNRWDTNNGEFGLLASISTSELKSDINGYQSGPPFPRGDIAAAPGQQVAVLQGFQLRTNEVDRDRDSYYLAGQWRSNDDSLLATAKYVRVENDIESLERTREWFPDATNAQSGAFMFNDVTLRPFTSQGIALCNGNNEPTAGFCDTLTPVDGGLFESGNITSNADSWYGAYGLQVSNLGIGRQESSTTQDISLNLKWRPDDKWYVELDGHYTDAKANFQQLWIGSNSFADVFSRPDLNNPILNFSINSQNTGLSAVAGPNVSGVPTGTGDPNFSFFAFAADEFRVGTGDEFAVRADIEREFDGDGWFDSVKFGARFSERSQVNSESGLNWNAASQPWNGGVGLLGAFQDQSAYEVIDFANFFRGGVVGGDTQAVFASPTILQDYDAFVNLVATEPGLANTFWSPTRNADGVIDFQRGGATVSDIVEQNFNAYARLDFGKEFDNGMSLDGNFGVRYVKTNLDSTGNVSRAQFTPDEQVASTPDQPRTDDAESRDAVQDFLPQTVAFFGEEGIDPVFNEIQTLDNSYDIWLPSFNLKWNLNDDMLMRFGVSRGLTRPNIQDLRAGQSLSAAITRINFAPLEAGDPLFGVDRGAQDIFVRQFNLNGGNPLLQPTTAWGWDMSFEWYFEEDGSFTASVFGKELEDIVRFGSEVRDVTQLDGQDVNIFFNGVVNQRDADVTGIELAFQKFFEDELPGVLGNLGVQANYTYIDASATPPPPFLDNDGDGQPDAGSFENIFRFGLTDLLGQSSHTANIVGIYQDEKLEMRLAYNYRSDYLNSYREFITGNPVFQEGSGFLDGSIKYDFNENIQLRLSVANILDTKSKSSTQVDQVGQRIDRSSFINDRRVEFGVRWQY